MISEKDYNEYYIQGSDHYLIPKDIFAELFNEMINWKEENKQLKDNWNKLKDHFKILKINSTHDNKEFIEKIINLIQELERNDSYE